MVGHGDHRDEDWKVEFYLMLGVQFVMSMSLTVIVPLLPFYLPVIGITNRADILMWTGLLSSVNLFVAAAVAPLWGHLGDRHGRKVMVLRSSAAISLFTFAMIFAVNVWVLLALRAAMGAFSGFGAAANTLVAARVPRHRLGFALGWLSTTQMMGSFFGPLAGGMLLDQFGDQRVVFVWTATLAAIACFLVWRLVPQDRGHAHPRDAPDAPARRWTQVLVPVLPFFTLLLIAQVSLRSVQPIVTVFVTDLAPNAHNVATLAGLAFSVVGLADLVGSPFLGKRSDSIGYRRVLVIALLGGAAFTLPQAFASDYWVFLGERFCVGLFIGSIIPTTQALLARSIPRGSHGLAYGIGASATFLGGGLGPILGSTTAATLGIPAVFLATTVMLAVAAAWVVWLLPAQGASHRPTLCPPPEKR